MKFLKSILILIVILLIIVGSFLAADRFLGLNNTQRIFQDVKKGLGIESSDEPQIDTRPIEITTNVDSISAYEDFASILIKSNKPIKVEESSRFNLVGEESLIINQKEEGRNYYVLEITNIGEGEGVLSIDFNDEAGNIKTLELNTFKERGFSLLGEDRVMPWENTKYIVDGDDLNAEVNKGNRLLSTYIPSDLINIKENYVNLFVNDADFELREVAADQLNVMLNDLRAETGKNVVIASAYRSYDTQAGLYASYVREFGQAETDEFSARPGYSEHQLGTVLDFVNDDSGFELTPEFDNTIAGTWLRENASKYGFIQSYPKDSEGETGYAYEAWQYRYIGE